MTSDTDTVFLAHIAEVEELGWAEVLARMDRWALHNYRGTWQDDDYDLPADWSFPAFPRAS